MARHDDGDFWSDYTEMVNKRLHDRATRIAYLEEGLRRLRHHLDGNFETDAGGFNVTVYDYVGIELIDALLDGTATLAVQEGTKQ